jgi:hypothetical protein
MTFPRRFAFFTGMLFATLIHTQAAEAQPPANRPPPEPPLPLLFKETWKETPAAVLISQEMVSNPALLLTVYGNSPDVNSEGGTPHVWTGLCAPACAVTLKLKDSYADLSGKSHITWYSKTSGFHAIRPVVKLADGTLLAGDFADANTY